MDSPPINACSLGQKEFPEVGFHMATIWQSIKVELHAATRCKTGGEIVEKKFPLRSSPRCSILVPIESSHMGGDEIEWRSGIRQ